MSPFWLAFWRFFGRYPPPEGSAICKKCEYFFEYGLGLDSSDYLCCLNAKNIMIDSVSGQRKTIGTINCYKKNPTGLCQDWKPIEPKGGGKIDTTKH